MNFEYEEKKAKKIQKNTATGASILHLPLNIKYQTHSALWSYCIFTFDLSKLSLHLIAIKRQSRNFIKKKKLKQKIKQNIRHYHSFQVQSFPQNKINKGKESKKRNMFDKAI